MDSNCWNGVGRLTKDAEFSQTKKGTPMSCFLVQNQSLGALGSIDSPFLVVFGDIEKSLFFDVASGYQQIRKNLPIGAAKGRKGHFGKWPMAPPGSPRARIIGN